MGKVEKAEVLLAFAEWQGIYNEPNFEVSARASAVLSALFQAFQPWNVNLTNISTRQNPANAAEFGIIFNLLNERVVFSVGMASAGLVVKNPQWSEAELFIELGRAAFEALEKSLGGKIREHNLSLSIHLKPNSRSVYEISSRFVSPDLSPAGRTVKCYGFSAYGEDFSWVVDSSALYDAALFFKIRRRFYPSIPFAEMVQSLRSDEKELLTRLKLQVDHV